MEKFKNVRIIDANSLKELLIYEFKQSGEYTMYETGIGEALNHLDNQPTIDPDSLRPHGKWVGEGMDARCGHCGEHPLKDMNGDSVWYWSYKPMFCPNCGAKMEE